MKTEDTVRLLANMPLSPSKTRDLLGRLGQQPKRFLGQNFLVDGNIVHKSLELAEVKPGVAVVEVGPGLGTLTSVLLEAGAEVWAIEKDRNLHAYLADTLVRQFPTLHLLEGDALEHPRAGLTAERAGDFKVVANLPYAISTLWMDEILSGPLPNRMVLMLQQETAQRCVAKCGTKQFSVISIFVQSAYVVERGHKVGAACFYPKPGIESYLINLALRPFPFVFEPPVKQIIRACFQQRRKQIGSLLRDRLPNHGAAWLSELTTAGFDARVRPEDIPPQLWQRLYI